MEQFFRENLSPEGLVQLNAYRNQTGIFNRLFERQFESWKIFWRAAEHFYPELSRLAVKLLHIPASTGDLERLFSEWAYVHSKIRNRLTDQRSKKLIALYYNLRLKYIDLLEGEEQDDVENME